MKTFTTAALVAALLSATAASAGNLSEPIMEQEPVAALEDNLPQEPIISRDAIETETAASGGDIFVPAFFLVVGGAVAFTN